MSVPPQREIRIVSVVRSYHDVKYLSLPKDGANIVEFEDMGDVAEDDLSEYSITVHGAEVIGVLTLESYAACLVCKAKVGPTTGKLGRCTKCKMQQVIDRCKKQLNSKVLISSSTNYLTLKVFGSNVIDIAHVSPSNIGMSWAAWGWFHG